MKLNLDGTIFWLGIFVLSFHFGGLPGVGAAMMICGFVGVLTNYKG
jgi:hypothetical protein